ncbi:hypothetical protein EBH_0020410 [Eimeria brunetti]|uniref:Uncharacterized protein n=1 Tax=Eimeria brunetti TaxID=51314 RepID=U6LGU6_9EIME|nr:hypothetical protein EBH_0020410 [Eimeria brunetti]
MMRKWVSKIALCGLAAALQVAAAPSRPPPADAYNNSGYAGPPAHAEAYPDRRGWGDSSLPYRSADGNTAAAVAAGAENANPAAGYEDIPWQNEAAPAVAKGAGPRNGQEAVMDHSAFSVGNMAASRGPEFAAQANGFGGFQGGGGDMQGMLMHPGEPMARLLLRGRWLVSVCFFCLLVKPDTNGAAGNRRNG